MVLAFAVVPLSSTEQQWLSTGASDRKVSGVAAALRLLVFVLPNAGLWTAWLLLQPAKRREEPSVTDTLAFEERSRIGASVSTQNESGSNSLREQHLVHIQ